MKYLLGISHIVVGAIWIVITYKLGRKEKLKLNNVGLAPHLKGYAAGILLIAFGIVYLCTYP